MPRSTPKRTASLLASGQTNAQWGQVVICGMLLVFTFLLFLPVRNHEFINYDDPDYITANPIVQQGVTVKGIQWAFTSSHSYNWHPVTWISHMVDVRLFGMNAGAHHMVNVTFHAASAVLLFLLVGAMTGHRWMAAFVAAVFAWHPLHVESVAWACERKDVLSTFFWFLCTWFYVRYVRAEERSQRMQFYVVALLCFAIGLMSKPMLVTLPFTLLLLDIWPLKRMTLDARSILRLATEKWPFFLLTLLSSLVTFLVQRTEGAVVRFEHLSVGARLANAAVSYVRYLGKTFWPADLTIYYQPATWASWQVASATFLLLALSICAFISIRKQPAFFVGWFWFLGTLVPVIGIVQVGSQAIADRYMYVPMLGLCFALWPAIGRLNKQNAGRTIAVFASITVSFLMLWSSARQIQVWRDSETVFTHALRIHPENIVASVMLANALLEKGDFAGAERQFQRALTLDPKFAEVHFNLGNLCVQQGRAAEAIDHYNQALAIRADYADAHANLAVALGIQHRFEDAVRHYEAALAIHPHQPDLLRNLALDLMTLNRLGEARARLEQALSLNASDAIALLFLGNVSFAEGKFSDAAAWYTRALEKDPNLQEARERLAGLQGR